MIAPVASVGTEAFPPSRRRLPERAMVYAVFFLTVAWHTSGFAGAANVHDVHELAKSLPALPHSDIPAPWLPLHPEWERLYHVAVQLAMKNVRQGTTWNGFAPAYIDEGYDNSIYQWDSIFISQWARHLPNAVPAMGALDSFYGKQHRSQDPREDGAISRQLWEADGSDVFHWTSPEYVNPPLFAWAEWDYYRTTGDASRLVRVLPILDRYYRWLERTRQRPTGHYFASNQGTGMDNTPTPNDVWGRLSTTAQQALAAQALARIADTVAGDRVDAAASVARQQADVYRQRYASLRELINETMWNDEDGFYYNVHPPGSQLRVQAIDGFWPLLAGVATPSQAARVVGALDDPDRFATLHQVPSLAVSHPAYRPGGAYWRGGVWPPTNYVVVQALSAYGYHKRARDLAANHLENLYRVYANERHHTLWEYYTPGQAAKGFRARPDFVGWTGLGPISMLIENIIGVTVDVPAAEITWVLLEEAAGLRNLSFGDARLDLTACWTPSGTWQLSIRGAPPLRLRLVDPQRDRTAEVPIGGPEERSILWMPKTGLWTMEAVTPGVETGSCVRR